MYVDNVSETGVFNIYTYKLTKRKKLLKKKK
jgi:hypothetical protein